ncbi:MAG: hypothetical protein JNL80_09140 [Phycisphaerae bacterium]|nr:hypothetical protein [Phycisphaerae bacterium]
MSLFLRSTVALCGVSLLSAAPSVFAQSSTWVAWDGNWNVAANWSNGVPGLGGANEAVFPPPPRFGQYNVYVNVSPTLSWLSIGQGVYLAQENNIDVTIGNVERNGTWFVTSTGASTDIRLSGDAIISGGGAIVMSGSASRILGVGGTRQLTLTGGIIEGSGQVGVNSLVLVNEAIVGGGGLDGLVLDLAPAPMSVNRGTLAAYQSSKLTILSSEIDNTDGTILATPQGTVLFRSSVIHGGTIEVQPGGSAEGTFEATTFDGITLKGTFTQPNNADSAVVGTIVNEGIWSLEAINAGTEVRIGSDVVVFDGPGKLLCSNSDTNKIITSVVGRTFVNGPLHTVSGAAQIGAGGLVLHNLGLIEATQSAGLTVDAVATPASTNSGTILARAGAPLLIVGTPLDNTDGVIRAEEQGDLTLQTSTISGGRIETDATGEIHGSVYPPTLVDLSIDGTVRQVEGADFYLSGTIIHDGNWWLEGESTPCEILLTSDVVTVEGGGQWILAGAELNNRIHSSGGTSTLVNGPNHVIRGGGAVGVGDTILVNHGSIFADASLVIDTVDAPASLNTGTITAEQGGILEIYRSNLVNEGTIYAGEYGTVFITGSTITGGTIAGLTDGEDNPLVVVQDTNTVSRFDSLTFDANGLIANGAELRVRSHLTNHHDLLMLSMGSDTRLALEPGDDGTVTIDGMGVFRMSDNPNNRISSAAGVMTLIHGSDHTIEGSGSIGNSQIAIANYGKIVSTHAQPLLVKTPSASIGLANHGHVLAASTGEFRVEGGAFTNDGIVESGPNCSLVRIGSLLQTSGMTKADGGLTVTGTYTQTGGLLTGDGMLNGNAWIEGGSTSASGSDGSAVGSLSVHGNYGQTLDGGLIVDLGAGGNDVLSVTGMVTLGGALQIRLVDPFIPMPGQEFTILTATNISGTFGCIEYPLGNAFFHVVYTPQAVKLVVDSIPVVEADLNFDGVVGAQDLAILLGAWGEEPCSNAICCPADLNGDGKVNAPDLATLLGEWS